MAAVWVGGGGEGDWGEEREVKGKAGRGREIEREKETPSVVFNAEHLPSSAGEKKGGQSAQH